MAKILLVDDDIDLAGRVSTWLKFQHHLVETVHDGREAVALVRLSQYELIILDWNMPHLSGIEACRQIRSEGFSAPVLMLTGNAKINEKEEGFGAGADDYLTKPFELRELSARVTALLRRKPVLVSSILEAGDLTLDTSTHKVRSAGKELHLEPKEFAILALLMRHQKELFTPEALLERIRSSESESTIDTVRTCIKKLRKKISPDGEDSIIKTVHKRGYTIDIP